MKVGLLMENLLTKEKNYFIKENYLINKEPLNWQDSEVEMIYQSDVDDFVNFLAERSQSKYIIKIGLYDKEKLKKINEKFSVILLDFPQAKKEIDSNQVGDFATFYHDLESGWPEIAEEIIANSIIVINNVVEHLINPQQFLKESAEISYKCKYMVLTTPDRNKINELDHFGPPNNKCNVREWSFEEFHNLLKSYNFNFGFIGHTAADDLITNKNRITIIGGRESKISHVLTNKIKVLAIIHVFNECDIIIEIINHLLDQKIEVNIIDNWSTDGTYELVMQNFSNNKKVQIERFPDQPGQYFELKKLLNNTVRVAKNSQYDWVIHCDADEARYSPWENATLLEAIGFVDGLGYNAIDFTILDFRPVENQLISSQFENNLINFEFGKRPAHFVQIKAWKNLKNIDFDLASSGGHQIQFAERKIYPLKFLLKHYSIRNREQALKKVIHERKARFSPDEKKNLGWHTHYDNFTEQSNFIWPKKDLFEFKEQNFYDEYLLEALSGIGVNKLALQGVNVLDKQKLINLKFYSGKDLYSDGEIEDEILEIVKKNQNYEEIIAKDERWPILYHLTPIRRNLLEWYPFDKDAELLEIGAGCGAVTGLFCEKVNKVTAVELSKRRAEIIAYRHQDKANLDIIVGNLNDIVFHKKFDYISLIGVLEYAGKYTNSENPYKDFLGKLRNLLKPEGKLIIAIENKFGLKYWSGAPEDHTGKVFDGLEGYLNNSGVYTFGQVEIENLLTESGYKDNKFYYPYPDYKLPMQIISPRYIKNLPPFKSVIPAYDQDKAQFFDENAVYESLKKNNLFGTFANSFLIFTTKGDY